jgi:hypothetical protein
LFPRTGVTAIKLRKNSPLLLKEGPGVVKKIYFSFKWLITTPLLGKEGENPA